MQFEWDEAKFQMKTPLRELSESISGRIGSLDEELKMKMTEVGTLKSAIQVRCHFRTGPVRPCAVIRQLPPSYPTAFQGAERKTQGNLLVRTLTDIVKEEHVMETEFMTTAFIVVPRHGYKEVSLPAPLHPSTPPTAATGAHCPRRCSCEHTRKWRRGDGLCKTPGGQLRCAAAQPTVHPPTLCSGTSHMKGWRSTSYRSLRRSCSRT